MRRGDTHSVESRGYNCNHDVPGTHSSSGGCSRVPGKRKRILPPFDRISNPREHTCAICLEAVGQDDDIISPPACTHRFHRPCMVEWAQKGAGTCPVCRQGGQSHTPLEVPGLGDNFKVIIRTNGENGEGDITDTTITIHSDEPDPQKIFDETVCRALLALSTDSWIRVALRDAMWYSFLFRDHPHIHVQCDEYDDEHEKVTVTTLSMRRSRQQDSFNEFRKTAPKG